MFADNVETFRIGFVLTYHHEQISEISEIDIYQCCCGILISPKDVK